MTFQMNPESAKSVGGCEASGVESKINLDNWINGGIV